MILTNLLVNMIKKKVIFSYIYFYLILLLVLFIPLYKKFIPYLAGLIVLNWVIEFDFINKFKRLVNDRNRLCILSFSVLYIFYLIGVFYSSNIDYALFDLEVKLMLLLFPLVFSTIDKSIFTPRRIVCVFAVFIAGCFIGTLVCFGNAVYNFTQTNSVDYFYYSNLSIFHHSGYFAMYLNFAIALIIYFLLTNWKQNLNKWKIGALSLLIIYFLIFIILLSSKAGMLTLIIIFLLTVSYLIIFEKRYFQGALIFLMVCVLFIGAFKLFPKSLNRIIIAQEALENRNKIEHGASEGTTGRLLIWENSLEIIRNNFLFGVGTGDVKDFLLEKYEENKFTYYQNKEFNAHNQYLQTFISLGLFGFLILLLTLILPLAYAIKNKQFIYLFFLIIFSLNLLVESMFETQAGVVFYAFFNSFLLFINKKPRQEET